MATQGCPGADLLLLADDEGCIVVRTLEDDGTEREQSWRGATVIVQDAGGPERAVEVRYGRAVVARWPSQGVILSVKAVPWTMTREGYLGELERSEERLARSDSPAALTAEGMAHLAATRHEVEACEDAPAFARWYAVMMADSYAAIYAFTEAVKTDEALELRDFMVQWEARTGA